MSEHKVNLTDQAVGDEQIVFSNAISLNARQWVAIVLLAVAFVIVAPMYWTQFESFPLERDYRIPHDLSQDYWLFERYTDLAVEEYDTILLGDSVIWGEYVTRQETLSHYLNKETRTERFANLGLDGAHPLGLLGLIEHYAGGLVNRNVMLECNPLWMSSPQADLQDDKKVNQFNHPRLVPQAWFPIPSYQNEISPRLGVLVEQRVPFSKWTNHLQQAYYQQGDIPSWTLDHPYDNPLEPLSRGLPSGDELRHLQQPWYQSGIAKQDYSWVAMKSSLQWAAFRRVVGTLQSRGNRVFVLVGPFNEHLLTPASRDRYEKVKGTITAWLKEKQIPHLAPAALPSEQYADASHPLAAGYERLARQLLEDTEFRSVIALP